MLKPEDLKENSFYFQMYYLTDKSLAPEIKTYFYLGKNIYKKGKPENTDEYYFQESESYQKYGSALNKKGHSKYKILLLTKELHLMHDLQSLIERLQKLENKINS